MNADTIDICFISFQTNPILAMIFTCVSLGLAYSVETLYPQKTLAYKSYVPMLKMGRVWSKVVKIHV